MTPGRVERHDVRRPQEPGPPTLTLSPLSGCPAAVGRRTGARLDHPSPPSGRRHHRAGLRYGHFADLESVPGPRRPVTCGTWQPSSGHRSSCKRSSRSVTPSTRSGIVAGSAWWSTARARSGWSPRSNSPGRFTCAYWVAQSTASRRHAEACRGPECSSGTGLWTLAVPELPADHEGGLRDGRGSRKAERPAS